MQALVNLGTLIDKIKQSADEWEIINHFYQTPKACETVADIAKYLGKSPDQVEHAVRDLEQLGILHNCGAIWGKPSYVTKYTEFYSLEYRKELESVLDNMFKN